MHRHLLLLALLTGCPTSGTISPFISPAPVPDSSLCASMCQHIGPVDAGGLGCEEGEPLYDSTKPGPLGVPNETCTEFCQHQQANGVFINPRCVMTVTSCSQIEAARAKVCP
jgi:hypothetical protein